MKKLFVAFVVFFSFESYSQPRAISKQDLIDAGIARYKTLSQEEIDYIERNKDRRELISAINRYEEFGKIKLAKKAYAQIVAEYNVSALSLLKYSAAKNLGIDEDAIRSTGYYVAPEYLNALNEKDTINEMVCYWTWKLNFPGFFQSQFYRYHPEKKSNKMNEHGPVNSNAYGVVDVECNVPEGEIFMDDKTEGLFTNQKIVVLAGDRRFQIKKEGYITCDKLLTVKNARTQKLVCELKSVNGHDR